MALKLPMGALPAVRPAALSELAIYANGPLPAPPAEVGATVAPYPIDANQELGDCTFAGAAHLVEAWNVEYQESDPTPTRDEVVEAYYGLTGGEDAGCVEADVLKHWHQNGLFGRKIAGYAPVPPSSILDLHRSIAFYGGVYLGIACPQSCQEQFAEKLPWTYVEGSPILGGHCIVGVGYDHEGIDCVTWGETVKVTYPFLAHYCSEAWAIIGRQLVERGHDTLNIDLKSLERDLKLV